MDGIAQHKEEIPKRANQHAAGYIPHYNYEPQSVNFTQDLNVSDREVIRHY